MAEESRNGQEGAEKKSRPWLWPVIITGLICCVFCALLWHIFSGYSQSRAAANAEAARIDELKNSKAELLNLLKLPPCDVKARLYPGKPAAETTPAKTAPVPEKAAAIQENSARAEPQKSAARPAGKVETIENACVFLVATDGRSSLSTGSGFFVAPGYVVTNRHVVENGHGKVLATSRGLGRPAIARVVAKSDGENQDYALLAVEMPPNAHTTALPFALKVEKTQKVGAWGYPNIIGKADPAYARLLRGEDFSATPELSYTEGVVSAVLRGRPEIIAHTAPISPGNSGGPLVNESGEVVGINTMITLDETSYRQASLALAAADLIRFLNANGVNIQK